MRTREFTHRSRIAAPAPEVFAWHERPGALERLSPPWAPVEVLERRGGIRDGGRVVLRVPFGPFTTRWVAEHRGYQQGLQFQDEQVEGPFGSWLHTHRFETDGPWACEMVDRVQYAMPLQPFGDLFGRGRAERELTRAFRYRHAVVAADVERHRAAVGFGPARIAVTGATGLIGSQLCPFLSTGGHEVVRIVRRPATGVGAQVLWDPDSGDLAPRHLEGLDAVVHLAGENIAAGRWTPRRRAHIETSRIEGTRLVARTLAGLKHPPRILVCASAVGFYGDRGDTPLDESSDPGIGWLSDLCRAWEEETLPAKERGIRVVHLRLGIVLSAAGGVLAKMLPAFRRGLGGRVGSGCQVVSWIALEDVLGAIHFVLLHPEIAGPVNVTSPYPVMQQEFARFLGRVLGRPAVVPLPSLLVKVLFGGMGRELLLSGQRVLPHKLLAKGFAFRHPGLEEALRFELGRFGDA